MAPQHGMLARLAGPVLAAAALAACASPAGLDLGGLPPGVPERVEIAAVPFLPQDELYCGPAALATVLTWSGAAVSQAELAPAVFTPGRQGTLQQDLLSAARRHGRLAVPVADLSTLLAELAAGHPVLVLQNLGLALAPQWHYAVAVGYDRATRELVLRSGREARRRVSFATFEHTWARADRWAFTMLPPDRLPATGEEDEVLQAATGLERSGRLGAAATAYQTALERWPGSLGALIGLANARYGAGELGLAEEALRRAADAHPDSATAWNNLAHVLAARGRPEAALAAARRAVALGGQLAAIARTTEAEILEIATDEAPTEPPRAVALADAPPIRRPRTASAGAVARATNGRTPASARPLHAAGPVRRTSIDQLAVEEVLSTMLEESSSYTVTAVPTGGLNYLPPWCGGGTPIRSASCPWDEVPALMGSAPPATPPRPAPAWSPS